MAVCDAEFPKPTNRRGIPRIAEEKTRRSEKESLSQPKQLRTSARGDPTAITFNPLERTAWINQSAIGALDQMHRAHGDELPLFK
jgi:hypothetical protein